MGSGRRKTLADAPAELPVEQLKGLAGPVPNAPVPVPVVPSQPVGGRRLAETLPCQLSPLRRPTQAAVPAPKGQQPDRRTENGLPGPGPVPAQATGRVVPAVNAVVGVRLLGQAAELRLRNRRAVAGQLLLAAVKPAAARPAVVCRRVEMRPVGVAKVRNPRAVPVPAAVKAALEDVAGGVITRLARQEPKALVPRVPAVLQRPRGPAGQLPHRRRPPRQEPRAQVGTAVGRLQTEEPVLA